MKIGPHRFPKEAAYRRRRLVMTSAANQNSFNVNCQAMCASRRRHATDACQVLISEKPLSGKLQGPDMRKAFISDKGFAKCIWSLSGKSVFFDDDDRDSTSTTSRCFFRRRRTLISSENCSRSKIKDRGQTDSVLGVRGGV